jgi:hypothetical protein
MQGGMEWGWQDTWQHGSAFLACLPTNPPLPPKLEILLCSLAIYKPIPLPATPTPLCILNLVFHTNFLSHFVFLRSMRQLLVMANIPSSPILATLMMEAPSSSETSVPIRATRRNIPEEDILLTLCLLNKRSVVDA